MRRIRLSHCRAGALALAIAATGCRKEISSDERLDRATTAAASLQTVEVAELENTRCDDTAEELATARNENGSEADRVMNYLKLYESLKLRRDTIDAAMGRNPDLAYQHGSERLIATRDTCVRQVADIRLEFERYVRELVALPTVKEIKGGKTVTIVRLEFSTLRLAIEALELDDRDVLVTRLERAEKTVKPR